MLLLGLAAGIRGLMSDRSVEECTRNIGWLMLALGSGGKMGARNSGTCLFPKIFSGTKELFSRLFLSELFS